MDEYIRREDVIRQICLTTACSYYGEVVRTIIDFPAADVQPVVYAHWIELPKTLNSNENPCKCSNCGHILSFYNGYPKSKYCDTCGAKMEQEE